MCVCVLMKFVSDNQNNFNLVDLSYFNLEINTI